MLACALSPACSSSGSRPTLPDRIIEIRPRWVWPFLRSQLRKASVAPVPSGVTTPKSSLNILFTRIGSSSIARMTGRPLAASAAKTSSPLRGQFPASIPPRSFTLRSATDNSSIRPPAALRKFPKSAAIRSHAPRSGLACTPISAIASAGSAAASRSTKTVSNSPVSPSRRNNSRTRLVLPMRRCAVSRVWVPS